jgi:hypothetical protein
VGWEMGSTAAGVAVPACAGSAAPAAFAAASVPAVPAAVPALARSVRASCSATKASVAPERWAAAQRSARAGSRSTSLPSAHGAASKFTTTAPAPSCAWRERRCASTSAPSSITSPRARAASKRSASTSSSVFSATTTTSSSAATGVGPRLRCALPRFFLAGESDILRPTGVSTVQNLGQSQSSTGKDFDCSDFDLFPYCTTERTFPHERPAREEQSGRRRGQRRPCSGICSRRGCWVPCAWPLS